MAIVDLAIAAAQDVGWHQGRVTGTACEEAGAWLLSSARRWLGLPDWMGSAHGQKTIEEHSNMYIKSSGQVNGSAVQEITNAYIRSPEALRR